MSGVFLGAVVLLVLLAIMLGYVVTVVACAMLEIDETRNE